MSREFREVSTGYMHYALSDAADIPGEHPVSKALAAMYAALQPVEREAAAFEASDSGFEAPAMALLQNATEIADAARAIADLAAQYSAIACAVLRVAHSPTPALAPEGSPSAKDDVL